MREKEKERGKKKRVIQRATHTTTNATSFFYERGKEKRKVMQLPAYVFLFFFYSGGDLRSILYSTINQLHYSPTSFLYEIIKVSLTNRAFALLGRESK